jgi:predicted DNA-binding protein
MEPKDQNVNLRMSEEEVQQLEELARRTVRTKSDMVRYLIRKEYQSVVDKPRDEDSTNGGQAA